MSYNLKLDKSAKSLSYRVENQIFEINNKIFEFLKKKSNNFRKQVRICFNNSTRSRLHQMIIVQPSSIRVPIKQHPNKDKSYIFIKGKEEINIFNRYGKKIKKIKLGPNNPIVWLPKKTWHNNISLEKYSIHIETISGPFSEKKDRIYL